MYITCKTSKDEEKIEIFDYIVNPRQVSFQCELTKKQVYVLYNEFAIVTLNQEEKQFFFDGQIKINSKQVINKKGDISCWLCVEGNNDIRKLKCCCFSLFETPKETTNSLMDVYDYEITPYRKSFTIGVNNFEDMPNFKCFNVYIFDAYDKNGYCGLVIPVYNIGSNIKKNFLMAKGDKKIYELELLGVW